jgi:ABC-type phosphate transport system substrate-binding protein
MGAVKRSPGSIGYGELIYVLQNEIAFGSVQNKEGT